MKAMNEISMQVDIPAPDEPLPDNRMEEDGWETEEEEEEVFVHGLGDVDIESRKRSNRFTTKIDYKARLIEEQRQWKDLEESLAAVYMLWRTSGPFEESEADTDWFSCKMVSLKGKCLYLLL